MACLLSSCSLILRKIFNKEGKDQEKAKVEKPVNSVAEKATWDICLIGTWKYGEEVAAGKIQQKGVEKFLGDGTYENFTNDEEGNKVVITGTWRLDDNEDYVVWIQEKERQSEKGTETTDRKLKYTIQMLTPQKLLCYYLDGKNRIAEWMEE